MFRTFMFMFRMFRKVKCTVSYFCKMSISVLIQSNVDTFHGIYPMHLYIVVVYLSGCHVVWSKRVLTETCSAPDGHIQRRVRRHRTIFTEDQLDALEELFRQNQYPDINTREQLAEQTHLREERVEVTSNNNHQT